MTAVDTTSLVDKVRRLVADIQAAVKASEDRLTYRRECGRQLSKAHEEALTGLRARLGVLTARLDALLGPDVDVAALKAEFAGLKARLEE